MKMTRPYSALLVIVVFFAAANLQAQSSIDLRDPPFTSAERRTILQRGYYVTVEGGIAASSFAQTTANSSSASSSVRTKVTRRYYSGPEEVSEYEFLTMIGLSDYSRQLRSHRRKSEAAGGLVYGSAFPLGFGLGWGIILLGPHSRADERFVIISVGGGLIGIAAGIILRLTDDFRPYSDEYIALMANDANARMFQSE